MNETDHQRPPARFSNWLAGAILTFAVAAIIDWATGIWSSTDPGAIGATTSLLVFVSIWIVVGGVWAAASGAVIWASTGEFSLSSMMTRGAETARRWFDERHTTDDATRCATLLSAAVGSATFVAAGLALTTHLIETRNLAWLIAVTSLAGQLAIGLASIVGALALRRLFDSLLRRLRNYEPMRWLNLVTIAAAIAVITIAAAIYGLVVGLDVYLAVEGPALTMVGAAVVGHPIVACVLDRRLRLPTTLRRTFWAIPFVAAVVAIGASQQSDARRILVLHGQAADFAFNHLHRHVDLDRFVPRGDCPPIGPDGRPVDGTSVESYDDECMDPAYDRPFARTDVPNYDRPDLGDSPSFVFITWDSVRIDRLGHMGHHRDTTPHLDAFADESLMFERAFTQDSGTGPSFWSLMAGKTPFQVNLKHAERFPPPIEESEPMLGELLEEAGYHNIGIMCGTLFDRDYWTIGAGFDRFDNVCGSDRRKVAPLVTDEAIEALETLADGDAPYFLWVHYWDPHHPYVDHPDIDYGDRDVDRYDQDLTYTDRHFARLLDAIDDVQADDDRPLYTIVGSDHGENFGEHGSAPHARNLYRNVTHVPKLIRGPGIQPRRITPPVAFNDIYPTVLDLAGVDIPDTTTMVSQVPVLFGAEPDEYRMVFQENSYSRPRRHTRAVVYDRYHYIMDTTTHSDELYDFVDDPLERHNLIGTGLDEEQILRQALIRFLRTTELPAELED